jgi:hypothetical protein
VRDAAWRRRRARGRRTAGAFSYSTQPPRPVGELTMASEANEGVGVEMPRSSLLFDVGAPAGGQAPLPSNDFTMGLVAPALPRLPGPPTSLALTRTLARLRLSAPTLDELLLSRKDKRL